ncbi:hypothetical protein SCARR_03651 [Pontiella sulfatireligans]|uniref:Uncharacterized protein n=1 Tax=Pontiella sulfatireligans TaxID=2750658 RepID=A0A6C2UQK2_9BACT|nr:hypothetical protein SCARR_03651 [Pontiella sulfatireligans]
MLLRNGILNVDFRLQNGGALSALASYCKEAPQTRKSEIKNQKTAIYWRDLCGN